MKYARTKQFCLYALAALSVAWAVFCLHRAFTGQIVLADIVVQGILVGLLLLSTASFGGKASRAHAHNARASSLGDTAYRRLRRAEDGVDPADWRSEETLEASSAYVSPANIAATASTLQPNEDGRELTDHGLILSVLAALRSTDSVPSPQRTILRHLVCEMALRFAHDSGMEERDRLGIIEERRNQAALDADQDGMVWPTARHMDIVNRAKADWEAIQAKLEEERRRNNLTPLPESPTARDLVDRFAERVSAAGAPFNLNSPEALDAPHAAADRPDPRDMGDALAYAFVGFDPAKPGTDQTVRHPFIALTASGLTDAELDQLVKSGHGQIIEHIPSHVTPLAAGTALHLFAAERWRQTQVEGYAPERDDGYEKGELAAAAACYAAPMRWVTGHDATRDVWIPKGWPWAYEHWKPTPDDRLREVVKAGALLLAEAERLIRADPTRSP